jgi:hypothetical protein
MKPEISEFSYGYCIVEQISRDVAEITAAPFFPSLIQEGREGGYDVMVTRGGSPLFLQFKLSDHLEKSAAREAKAKIMGLPYYRMHLRSPRYSDQHAMLMELEISRGQEVYYVAPLFHTPEELNDAYLNRQVFERSVFIKPSFIGPIPDLREHYVVFNAEKTVFCSTPKEIDHAAVSSDSFIANAKKIVETGKNIIEDQVGMENLMENMIQIVSPSSEKGFWPGINSLRSRGDRSPLEHAAYLARTFLGCEMLLMHAPGD